MQSGNRVLTPAEWCCLSDAVDQLRDEVESDVDCDSDDTETGIAVFDRLTAEQKLFSLAQVTEALVVESVPSPDHSAVNEGTIAAIFETLRRAIIFEIDTKATGTDMRRALLAALADNPPEDMPAADSTDYDEWDFMVECFETRVLWDRDFEMDDMADMPPDVAAEVDEQLRFGDGYFAAVADDPDAATLAAAREKLRRLVKTAPELPPGP